MGSQSQLRRQQAVVLIINDKVNSRSLMATRFYSCGIGTVVAPNTFEDLIKYLKPSVSPDKSKVSLIVLDYLFADWSTPNQPVNVHIIHTKILESGIAKKARVIIVTAYRPTVQKDKLLKSYGYNEIIDEVPLSLSSVESIVQKYIG